MPKITSLEGILLTTLKKGKHFYSEKKDKDLTAIAAYYGKRIKTEKFISVNINSEMVTKIVKVTLLK